MADASPVSRNSISEFLFPMVVVYHFNYPEVNLGFVFHLNDVYELEQQLVFHQSFLHCHLLHIFYDIFQMQYLYSYCLTSSVTAFSAKFVCL